MKTRALRIVSQKRGILLVKMNVELSPIFEHIPLFIVNMYFEFQKTQKWQRYDKMSQFLHNNEDDNDDTKAITIPRVSSKSSGAKNAGYPEKILGKSSKSQTNPLICYSVSEKYSASLGIQI